MGDKMRLVLLISGGGTTALEIIRACKSGRLKKVEPVCVISSKYDTKGVSRMLSEGVPVECIVRQAYGCAEEFGERILDACRRCGADLIGQYGWMPKTPANVIEAYAGRMINQHPGPLDPGFPDFGGKGMYGRRVHAARLFFVWETKRDYWTEATAQLVDLEFDCGAILHRRTVDVAVADDPFSLQERVLPVEHRVQIETLELFSNGNVPVCSRNKRLIRPGEESLLAAVKKDARQLFPTG